MHDAADPAHDLPALVASRICHDVVNPLGAVGNGLELLAMTHIAGGQELSLISESLAQATARIRFLRVAFGRSSGGAVLGASEIRAIVSGNFGAGRFSVIWDVPGDLPRSEVKLAFLLLQCLETSMPRGGTVKVTRGSGGWQASAETDDLRPDPGLWAALQSAAPAIAPPTVGEAQVHFALAQRELAGRGLSVTQAGGEMALAW